MTAPRFRTALLACAILILTPTGAVSAQSGPPPGLAVKRIDAPPRPAAMPLLPDRPAHKDAERWNELGGQRIVRNVTVPTLEPVLPDPAKATGAAVVVAPGGAFMMLSMDNEGWPVARWLADHGIAAFVLKYRLNPTATNDNAFMAELGARFAAAGNPDPATRQPIREDRATQDMLAALQTVRANAARWGVDPARVGALGFSAGAMTALASLQEGGKAKGPAFVGSIYGPMTSLPVRADAPPLFTALALDDGLFGRQGFGIVASWQAAGVPVEVHGYVKGGHGFGMGAPGTTTTQVMPEFLAWMKAGGWLQPSAAR